MKIEDEIYSSGVELVYHSVEYVEGFEPLEVGVERIVDAGHRCIVEGRGTEGDPDCRKPEPLYLGYHVFPVCGPESVDYVVTGLEAEPAYSVKVNPFSIVVVYSTVIRVITPGRKRK